jgi:hypothetical protein
MVRVGIGDGGSFGARHHRPEHQGAQTGEQQDDPTENATHVR